MYIYLKAIFYSTFYSTWYFRIP